MAGWFKKPDPKELMRENERNLRNRELDADRRQLERKEKELELEIKKLAKSGNREACATLAKQLVQLRKQKTKTLGMGAKITAVGAQNRHMYSMGKMSEAVATSTKTMKTMQKQMPLEKLAKDMREFPDRPREDGHDGRDRQRHDGFDFGRKRRRGRTGRHRQPGVGRDRDRPQRAAFPRPQGFWRHRRILEGRLLGSRPRADAGQPPRISTL
ncbi:hypothetical protein L596_009361 [Steinernema carpocapsae]|uniref:Uncharacterized protein n=1 Tax=Steinernema carpocapsae TaxID=34508 RepID=A0A4U5PF47_STECR|nr:hypothetical protein L596_009361 [Steinernema carpocapsae]